MHELHIVKRWHEGQGDNFLRLGWFFVVTLIYLSSIHWAQFGTCFSNKHQDFMFCHTMKKMGMFWEHQLIRIFQCIIACLDPMWFVSSMNKKGLSQIHTIISFQSQCLALKPYEEFAQNYNIESRVCSVSMKCCGDTRQQHNQMWWAFAMTSPACRIQIARACWNPSLKHVSS